VLFAWCLSVRTSNNITPGLAQSLLAVTDLVDSGPDVTLTATDFTARDGDDIRIHGPRDRASGLWRLGTATAPTTTRGPYVRAAPTARHLLRGGTCDDDDPLDGE